MTSSSTISQRPVARFLDNTRTLMRGGVGPIISGTGNPSDISRLRPLLDTLHGSGITTIEVVDRSKNALEIAEGISTWRRESGIEMEVVLLAGTQRVRYERTDNGVRVLRPAERIAEFLDRADVDGVVSPASFSTEKGISSPLHFSAPDPIRLGGTYRFIVIPAAQTPDEFEQVLLRQVLSWQPHPSGEMPFGPEYFLQKSNPTCDESGRPQINIKGILAAQSDLNITASSGIKPTPESMGAVLQMGAAGVVLSSIVGNYLKMETGFTEELSAVSTRAREALRIVEEYRVWKAPSWTVKSSA